MFERDSSQSTLAANDFTVVVADDSRAFCERLCRLLERVEGVGRVIAMADAQALLGMLKRGAPRVVVVDTQMGTPSGTTLLRQVRAQAHGALILALTRFCASPMIESYQEAGADACFDKHTDLEGIVRAVEDSLPQRVGR